MVRTVLIYASILAIAAFVLEWVEFQYMARVYTIEIYMVLIGVGITVLG